MKSETIPLAMPKDLMAKVRSAAKRTGLSHADVMRQSIKIGLPKVVERLSGHEVLKPLTAEECQQCWEVPDPEFDALAAYCAAHPPITQPQEE